MSNVTDSWYHNFIITVFPWIVIVPVRSNFIYLEQGIEHFCKKEERIPCLSRCTKNVCFKYNSLCIFSDF